MTEALQCRDGCGACCIAPSISSPIPGMPEGKPAGVRCVRHHADAVLPQPLLERGQHPLVVFDQEDLHGAADLDCSLHRAAVH